MGMHLSPTSRLIRVTTSDRAEGLLPLQASSILPCGMPRLFLFLQLPLPLFFFFFVPSSHFPLQGFPFSADPSYFSSPRLLVSYAQHPLPP